MKAKVENATSLEAQNKNKKHDKVCSWYNPQNVQPHDENNTKQIKGNLLKFGW